MKTSTLLTSLVISLISFSQETDWKLYTSQNGVNIYSMEIDCYAKNIPDQKAIIIKVVNTTDKPIQLEWDRAIWYNDKLITDNVQEDEEHAILKVNANSSVEGSCNTPSGPLYLYKDFITYQTDTKLTQFELQNIQVVRL